MRIGKHDRYSAMGESGWNPATTKMAGSIIATALGT